MAITTRKNSANNTLQLYKRVPKRYAAIEPRKFVWVSLHTDSQSEAKLKAAATWEQMLAGWEAKLAGDTTDADQRFAAARDLAEARGFRYLRVEQVAALPIDQLRDRVLAVPPSRSEPEGHDMQEAAALLGGAPEPSLTVTKALELYWSLAKDKTLGKSDDQIRRWKNPRIKAVKNFVDVVGDKAVTDITGDDMLDFRNWWMERLEEEDLTPNSANKDLTHLGDVLKTVNRMKRMGLVLPLTDLAFKEGDAKQRPPFSRSWIAEKLLAPGALAGMNPEARAILLTMINTGCRPSEVAALTANTIKLDHAVPHISIEPEGRQVKTKHAKRTIPILGVSLAALRDFPMASLDTEPAAPACQRRSTSSCETTASWKRQSTRSIHCVMPLKTGCSPPVLTTGSDAICSATASPVSAMAMAQLLSTSAISFKRRLCNAPPLNGRAPARRA